MKGKKYPIFEYATPQKAFPKKEDAIIEAKKRIMRSKGNPKFSIVKMDKDFVLY